MTEKRKPWAKWFWGDWRKDGRLRRCSYAARGLWADMLSLMGGECDHFGLLIMEGEPLGAEDLEGLLGGSAREIQKLLGDLEKRRVFSRVDDHDITDDVRALIPAGIPGNTIISRRMLRDKARDEKDRAIGSRGGNPNLRKSGDDGLTLFNQQGLTGGDKAQSLEARDQKPEKILSLDAKQVDLDFETWWPLYPRMVGKGQARKAYHAARRKPGVTAELLLEAARRFAATRVGEEVKYTAHPATWLNGERWLDAMPMSSGQGSVDPEVNQWRVRVRNFALSGVWLVEWGPKPGEVGCRAPAVVQAEFPQIRWAA